MGFKDDVRAKADEIEGELIQLNRRVAALENLANTLGGRTTIRETVRQTAVGAVDYGAIAFGLSEIKSKITSNFGHAVEVAREHQGVVDYFADVFAKSDPQFNRAEFERLADK